MTSPIEGSPTVKLNQPNKRTKSSKPKGRMGVGPSFIYLISLSMGFESLYQLGSYWDNSYIPQYFHELNSNHTSRDASHYRLLVVTYFYCVNISYLVDQCICPARSRSRQTLDKNVLSWALTGTGSVLLIRQVS